MTTERQVLLRVACVVAVLCIIFPLGQTVFADAADMIGEFPFNALEAVVTATLGYGLFEALFG